MQTDPVETADPGLITGVTSEISSEDKMMSLLSHLSILFAGILFPFIIWIVYKEKSRFIRFNALQSLFFHIAYIAFLFLLVIAAGVFGTVFGLIVPEGSPKAGLSVITVILMIALYALIIGSVIGMYAYSIFIAVKSFKGEIRKYPVIGNIIYKKIYGN